MAPSVKGARKDETTYHVLCDCEVLANLRFHPSIDEAKYCSIVVEATNRKVVGSIPDDVIL
jgi:hypothetical protein